MTITCPFCKKHISKSDARCPHCKRVLIEYIGDRNSIPNESVNPHKPSLLEIMNKHITIYYKKVNIILKKIIYLRFNKHNFNLNYLWLIPFIIFIVLLASGQSNNTTSNTKETSLPKNYNRLSNGLVLGSHFESSSRLGTFEIDNGTDDDAIVKLMSIKKNSSLFTVFIQAKSKFTIRNIPDGAYRLYFQTGKDWDEKSKKFLYYPSFSKFAEDFQFTTTRTELYDSIRTSYARYRITLNPVKGGTAKTNIVSESEFEKY